MLSSDDFGKDLGSVQTLQRKHDGLERDLAALEDKVQTLVQESDRLGAIHPEHAEQIRAKQTEILHNWFGSNKFDYTFLTVCFFAGFYFLPGTIDNFD